jgi:hypothetical protein
MDLLGRWLVEVFHRVRPLPGAPAMAQIWPSVTPDGGCDWIADARVLGETYPVQNPRDVAAVLEQQINALEQMTRPDTHTNSRIDQGMVTP